MDENEINLLLKAFKNSQHYKKWHPRREDRWMYNHEWINPEKIKGMSDNELKSKFIEYYSGGEGRQVFNQIWRDRIVRNIPKFREMLTYLLDESIPIEKRFSEVVSKNETKHIEGVGKALASAPLMDFNFDKYCIWNNKTEMGFGVLEWSLPYRSSDDDGTKYIKILEQLRKLRDDIGAGLNLSFDEADNFLHWISAEEEGKNAVNNIVGESAIIETGINFEAPQENFVQQLIERNFDNIFAPFNLKLYDEDPDQTGAQFSTAVGKLDFLAVDENKDFVVIELKIGKVNDSSIGQILRYMGYVKKNLALKKNVRGIIIAEDIDEKAEYAISMLPLIEFKKYKLNIQII